MVYRVKHCLTLTRNDDNDAIFKSNAVDGGGNDVYIDGKIMLSKISWFMPHMEPADKDKMEFYKIIESKKTLPVGYRMIQCGSASILKRIHSAGDFHLNHHPRYHVLS